MEAVQVMPEYNTSNVLNNLSNKKIYNIGISSHFLPTCASNLESAVKKYEPSEYVVIETNRISFSDKELTEIITHTVPNLWIKKRGFLHLLFRENPCFYLLFSQFTHFLENNFSNNQPVNQNPFIKSNNELLTKVLNNMSKTVSHSGAKLIIAYHPPVSLQTDGTLKIESNPEVSKQFSELCAQTGIYFLDMSERFLNEYEKNFTLPYGFFNTSVAKGHMNNDGHRMFADEIFKLMQRIEAQS